MNMMARWARAAAIATVVSAAWLGAASGRAAVGGPDGFGYCWNDGEPFNWINATAGGTQIPCASFINGTCSDGTANVPIPFAFTFYGVPYSTVDVGSDGNLQFNFPQATSNFTCAPQFLYSHAAMPFEYDLDLGSGGAVWTLTTGTTPNQIFTAEWVAVLDMFGGGPHTFEAQLHEGTNALVFCYQQMPTSGANGSCAIQQGFFAGGIFLEYAPPCGTGTLTNNKAIRFQTGMCTPVPTATRTFTATRTATRTITNTISPTIPASLTPTITRTPTITLTPSITRTSTESPTSTETLTLTPTIAFKDVKVGPNPVSVSNPDNNYVVFQGLDFTKDTVRIFTVAGEFVASPQVTGDPGLLPIGNVPNPNATTVPWYGGETRWDLRNYQKRFVAPGLYYYVIERRSVVSSRRVKETKAGTIVVLK